MTAPDNVAFLLDVDNTLLDNNPFAMYLGTRLEQAFGAADHLAMLQMAHIGIDDNPHLLQKSANTAIDSPPDLSIGHIGDLLNYELSHFLSSHRRTSHP
jgi:hypothetical protein